MHVAPLSTTRGVDVLDGSTDRRSLRSPMQLARLQARRPLILFMPICCGLIHGCTRASDMERGFRQRGFVGHIAIGKARADMWLWYTGMTGFCLRAKAPTRRRCERLIQPGRHEPSQHLSTVGSAAIHRWNGRHIADAVKSIEASAKDRSPPTRPF